MKVLLAILLINFSSIKALEIRPKRGLSADEQKMFLDELNKDRQDVGKRTGFNMNTLKYDMALEKKADSVTCKKSKKSEAGVALQLGSIHQEVYEVAIKKGYSMSVPLFWPTATKIGCSKTIKCSISLGEEDVAAFGEKFRGKTLTFHGVCFSDMGTIADKNTLLALNKTGLPHPSKYGDLLGVPKVNGAALNSFFFLILLVLVFYI